MTDKVQKIREEVENRYEYWKEKESNSHSIESEIRMSECQHLLLMFDSMQEEPVSEDLEEAVNTYIGYPPEVDECSSVYGKRQAFKAGAKWQKQQDSIPSKDLAELIDTLSKRYPEVSFAKLSRIAVMVAKWKEQQLMANAVEGVVHHFWKCKMASVHYNDPTGVPMAYFTFPEGLSAGDKVKIIVIKED